MTAFSSDSPEVRKKRVVIDTLLAQRDPPAPPGDVLRAIVQLDEGKTEYCDPWFQFLAATTAPRSPEREGIRERAAEFFIGKRTSLYDDQLTLADLQVHYPEPFAALAALPVKPDRDTLAAVVSQFRPLLTGKTVLILQDFLERTVRRLRLGHDNPRGLIESMLAEGAEAAGGLVAGDVEPWPDPVDGAVLLTEVVRTYTTYIVLTGAAADALALYTLMTYCFQKFDVLPNLLLKSPVKRCAKTKVLEVSQGLVRRPLTASNATAATLFRSIAAFEPTLLLDECDSFMTGKHSHNPSYSELKNVINSGHTKATAFVLRLVGDDHTPAQFSTYCPKLLASIGDLQDTVEDRSIILPMRRKEKAEQVARWRNKYLHLLEPLQRQALRWARDFGEYLADADPVVPDELNDRAQDCWRPLLAIADAVGGEWPLRARRAAKVLATDEPDTTEIGLRLLRDLKGIFENAAKDQLPTEFLIRMLTAVPEAPWATWHRGQPLSERGLANLLRPFGVRSSNQRDRAFVRKCF